MHCCASVAALRRCETAAAATAVTHGLTDSTRFGSVPQNAAVVGESSIAAEYGWTNSQKVLLLTFASRLQPCCTPAAVLLTVGVRANACVVSAQGMIISGFFYGYSIPQLLGGWCAARYGSRIVFFGMGVATLMNILTPTFASHGVYAALAGRVIFGLAQAPMWPTYMACISRWLLPEERSKLTAWGHSSMSVSYFIGTYANRTKRSHTGGCHL